MSEPPPDDSPAQLSPLTVGGFLVIVVALTLIAATGSWLYKTFDWTHDGFSSASPVQLVANFAGQAMKYFVVLPVPMVLGRAGRALPRRRYAATCGALLATGLVTAALTFWANGDGPVTTWPEWLRLEVMVIGTLIGLAGLGQCAYLARKARTSPPDEPSL